jgi:uncharacterized protein (UPF0332 family)
MSYDELLRSRRIRGERISKREIREALKRAERDLRTARLVMTEDWDWGFAIAHDAVLQACRAYMFSRGYRPASKESHKNVFAFMTLAMRGAHRDLIGYFDRMRPKRHRAIYDVAGLITETEAKSLFAKAQQFVKLIRQKLAKKR